ncbi:MAG TPA: TIGR03435 family protein [Bryobacteraceae bacterium]|nr:TIGR03435 family protein [Bryobacteraceae bacterium]
MGIIRRIVLALSLVLLTCATWPGQTPEAAPKFEFADVHPSPKPAIAANQFMRTTPVRNGRYQVHTASLLDLIRLAWGYDADHILGGPPSIDLQRFEIGAIVAEKDANATPPDTLKVMLQALLEDRFALKVHKDTKQLPGYALTAGKKPNLKEADGSGDIGCRLIRPPAQTTGVVALNGQAVAAGPSMLVHYTCAKITMESFAAALRTMIGSGVGASQVLDETGLKGKWDFEIHWSLGLNRNVEAETITASEAIEKQLGLKLEQRPVPTPVLVVESVNENPAPDPPGTAEALPPIPPPTAFEVADIRPTDPDSRGASFRIQNGRLTVQGMPMMFLLSRALDTATNEQIIGLPGDFDALRFNINAQLPAGGDSDFDILSMGPLLRNLLVDRFRMKYHTEERPQTVYRLTVVKPKMKKADRESRIGCRNANGPPGSPRGTTVMTCHNTSMERFATQLRNTSPRISWPVVDGTGLEGGWDFSLTFSRVARMNVAGGRGGEPAVNGGQAAVASDPEGGVTVFDAVEKQLGLKLEAVKRPMPVYVIDHIESKPTEN